MADCGDVTVSMTRCIVATSPAASRESSRATTRCNVRACAIGSSVPVRRTTDADRAGHCDIGAYTTDVGELDVSGLARTSRATPMTSTIRLRMTKRRPSASRSGKSRRAAVSLSTTTSGAFARSAFVNSPAPDHTHAERGEVACRHAAETHSLGVFRTSGRLPLGVQPDARVIPRHWQDAGHFRGLYPRFGSERLAQSIPEIHDDRVTRIVGIRQCDRGREHTCDAEAGIGRGYAAECGGHQCGSGHQHEGQRDFTDHERIAQRSRARRFRSGRSP